jgi:hypothetical protein
MPRPYKRAVEPNTKSIIIVLLPLGKNPFAVKVNNKKLNKKLLGIREESYTLWMGYEPIRFI